MSYLLGLIAVGVLFAGLHYFTELRASQKGAISLGLVVVVLAMVAYNEHADAQRAHAIEMELKYRHNQPLVCEGIDVNQSTFSFSVGTGTFIGRAGTPHEQRMIAIETCR